MNTDTMFSSSGKAWETPQWLFDALNAQIWFDLDPCATAENAKCTSYYSKEIDGLKLPWTGNVFVNPPYGREIGAWVAKSFEAGRTTAKSVVMLLPARTDTAWWHDYVVRARQIIFIRGRVKFGKSNQAAPFPSCVVRFGRHLHWELDPIDARGKK